jgi:hypothetical protein
MELRLLTTDAERRNFTRRLVEARETHGAGFKETEQSLVGEVHLTFGRLYGLFDDTCSTPDEMLAGFIMHNLATFGQSYPKPDLSHLPPKEVFEIGELWAVVAGAARAVRHGCAILTGLLKAKAVLVYPIFKPWNLTSAYKEFTAVGDPIQWPYAETLDGGKILVQAMLLEGAALTQRVHEASSPGFYSRDHDQRIFFENPFPMAAIAAQRARRNLVETPEISIPLQPTLVQPAPLQTAIPSGLVYPTGYEHNGYDHSEYDRHRNYSGAIQAETAVTGI